MKFKVAAHPHQVAILNLVGGKGIDDMSLREIGKKIGIGTSPQQVQHHLNQLVKYGFLDIIGGRYRVGKGMVEVAAKK